MLKVVTTTSAILLLFPSLLLAFPREVVHFNDLNCDPLLVPHFVDELGLAPVFPIDELIDATSTITNDAACPSDDQLLPNALVVMTNLTTTDWADVWYVADPPGDPGALPGTTISNFDGFVDDVFSPVAAPGQAFKIDTVGVNRPLVFESMAANGIFEAGETWHFIIDDYMNSAGLPAHLFDSLGVAGASFGGPPSSGSIIAAPVPEPGTFALLFVGSVALAFCWRRRRNGR